MKKIDFHIHTKKSVRDASFDFCQVKLNEYIAKTDLDCIAITNHNLFDKSQFEAIRDHVTIPVFPGIEIDLEKSQILVISDGTDLDDFCDRCAQVAAMCQNASDFIEMEDFARIFEDLGKYILIPHYDKKPAIKDATLQKLLPHVTAGEVSSPKKFMYCIKSDERLVPLYFSDCRISPNLNPLPTRQTYLDCAEVGFSAIRECFRDKNKVALTEKDGNDLFPIFEDGQHLSTGLNVVLGERSSGKSHTLKRISERFENVRHIKQFALIARDEAEDTDKFNKYLSQQHSLFSKDYLSDLQRVVEDVLDIDLEEDRRAIDQYIATLLDFARETEKHDTFSKARIYSEDAFPEQNQKGLRDLISSTKNLISNKEYKEIINKHINRENLTLLFTDLMAIFIAQEEMRLKKLWVNELTRHIKSQLQFRSAAPKITDVDLYKVALNTRKLRKFEEVVKRARKPRKVLSKQKRGFEIVAEVSPFKGAGELKSVSRSKIGFSGAFECYDGPYNFLQQLKKLDSPVTPAEFFKYFVKIEYRILNKDGFNASGGERSEFFLLDEIEGADAFDMLLIDEPESSFDNHFLKEDVNAMIKEISKKMPVVLVTHNNTLGASIKPDYFLCTRKEIEDGKISWRIYSGYPTSKELMSPDGRSLSTWDIMMGCLEAGPIAYDDRRVSYENLKN